MVTHYSKNLSAMIRPVAPRSPLTPRHEAAATTPSCLLKPPEQIRPVNNVMHRPSSKVHQPSLWKPLAQRMWQMCCLLKFWLEQAWEYVHAAVVPLADGPLSAGTMPECLGQAAPRSLAMEISDAVAHHGGVCTPPLSPKLPSRPPLGSRGASQASASSLKPDVHPEQPPCLESLAAPPVDDGLQQGAGGLVQTWLKLVRAQQGQVEAQQAQRELVAELQREGHRVAQLQQQVHRARAEIKDAREALRAAQTDNARLGTDLTTCKRSARLKIASLMREVIEVRAVLTQAQLQLADADDARQAAVCRALRHRSAAAKLSNDAEAPPATEVFEATGQAAAAPAGLVAPRPRPPRARFRAHDMQLNGV